jgi:signal transduction histidine kinase
VYAAEPGSTVTTQLSHISEDQLRANRYALVSRLADDLAHEIKNPLNAIVINLEVLKVRVGKGDPAAALERAAVIEQEVRRLHHLMDRLLQLMRPERDEASNLPVDSALDELLPLIEAQVRLARNEMSVDCTASVFVAVRRDVFKFAMLNILAAVHERLGEGGGVLTVTCRSDAAEVALTVGTESEDGREPAADTDPAFEHALGVAAALLAPTGGRIDRDGAGVTVRLPRAASM